MPVSSIPACAGMTGVSACLLVLFWTVMTGSDDDSGSDTDTGPNTDTATGDCEPGESRCVDNTPQTCSDAGEWIDGAVCAEGCLNGNCVTNSTGGVIRLTDSVPGWASVAGGTTGGGTDIGAAIRVSTMGELQNAARGSNPAIILMEPGNYNGSLEPGSNKTIIGTASGVTINGYLKISGDDAYNLIIRNIAVRGERCNTYDECKEGPDGVYIGNGAHHIWLDHIDIADGQDGNCDVTKEGDYVTISWTKFHYTYEKEHRYSNLIAGSDDETQSRGKLQITYMNCWWGERVDQRQPRGRFGKIHCLNNYHNTGGSAIHGVGKEMSLIAENSYYDEPGRSIWKDMGDPTGWKGIGNEGNASDMNDSMGSVFDIPYNYEPMPASQVPDAITASVGGAGNTCTLQE